MGQPQDIPTGRLYTRVLTGFTSLYNSTYRARMGGPGYLICKGICRLGLTHNNLRYIPELAYFERPGQ